MLLAALGWSAQAHASGLATGGAPEVPWLRVTISLGLCLALAAAAILALKRYRGGGTASIAGLLKGRAGLTEARITIIETRRIAPGASVCLVGFEGRELLLGISGQGVSVQTEKKTPSPQNTGEAP